MGGPNNIQDEIPEEQAKPDFHLSEWFPYRTLLGLEQGELKPPEFTLLHVIFYYMSFGNGRCCFAKVVTLAKQMGSISEKYIQRITTSLINKGWLTRRKQYNRRLLYLGPKFKENPKKRKSAKSDKMSHRCATLCTSWEPDDAPIYNAYFVSNGLSHNSANRGLHRDGGGRVRKKNIVNIVDEGKLVTNKSAPVDPVLSQFSSLCRNVLVDAVQREKKIHYRATPKTWPKEFEKLNSSIRSKKRILRVLKWYCKNMNNRYVPQAYTAHKFCDKFLAIEQAMTRHESSTPKRLPPRYEKMVKEIKSRVDRSWPDNFQAEDSIRISIRNWRKFRKGFIRQVKPQKDRHSSTNWNYKFAWNIYKERVSIHDCVKFLSAWYSWIIEQTSKWDNWGGSPKSIAFDPTSKSYERFMDIRFPECVRKRRGEEVTGFVPRLRQEVEEWVRSK